MKQYILFSLILLSAIGCKKDDPIEKPFQPATVSKISNENLEINKAISTAKMTLDQFDTAIKSKNPHFSFFALKSTIQTLNGKEPIWINKIELVDQKYFGIIDNLPTAAKDIKIGDRIEIDKNSISDWMYLENSILRGGYTIRVLRNEMTENEKRDFDKNNGIIIED